MPRFVDKPFHWVAILALASGAAVLVPSLAALGMTLVAVTSTLSDFGCAPRPGAES